MSEEIKCPHCGGEYQDYLTDVGICCFSCGTDPYEEQSRLCREIVARRMAENTIQTLRENVQRIGINRYREMCSLQSENADLREIAKIAVEYISHPGRRAFYRNQIEVAGTDAFEKGGAK